MTGEIVVVGLGNSYRSDDGVGIAAATALDGLALPGVRVVTGIPEPMALLEAWSGARLAVVIDAAIATPSVPGRIRRSAAGDAFEPPDGLSSHGIDIGRTHELGRVLGRVPDELVVFTVEVAATGHGVGLTREVADAVPEVVRMAAAEINRSWGPATRSPRPASR
ncbi:hydrogenase maturation protease [Mycobacterium sp. 663a-19]|uniref:hydrogenase maturation protease n=1 Tax=Mycobacterium sp. 663a-19 TaxID=2986148 RepID=UPI002D1F6360|nr:hydrogenase maturation protease [Mycobacterium sp. 663a-19]MEB3981571.1 hydrogenase maturation protease [Mycobacterium sp. 663a-19]